jgi:tRNA(Ile)-lysidine synthase
VSAVDQVLRDLARPSAGEALVVGVSGGADSVALLDALLLLAPPWRLRVVAAHLDHALRPDSGDDAAFCVDLCRRLGVPLRVGVADVAGRMRRERGGIEEAARHERYAFLRKVKEEEGAAAIAVAHTRDDQAETFLLRLLRGAGGTGLAAMRTRSRDLIRPLLAVTREEVLAHLRERGLPWREDPTNDDPRFRRNRVRRELIPYLESRINPSARKALARAAALAADESELLAGLARELAERIGRRDGEGVVLARPGLASAPRALARLAIRHWLAEVGGLREVSAAHVERILALAACERASGRRLPLPGGREACVRFGDVRIAPRAPAARAFARPLAVPGRVELPGGLAVVARAGAAPAASSDVAAVVPAPEDGAALVVRTRHPGDRVRRGGREVSLKRFLIARRVPADIRAALPLVVAGRKVLWIPGYGGVEAGPGAGRGWVHLELVAADGGSPGTSMGAAT